MNKEISFIVTEEQENQLVEYARLIGVEITNHQTIPDWQKKEVRKRLNELKNKPESLIPWDTAKLRLKERLLDV